MRYKSNECAFFNENKKAVYFTLAIGSLSADKICFTSNMDKTLTSYLLTTFENIMNGIIYY